MKKMTKASKRRIVLFGTISIAVIVYFFCCLSYYAYRIYELKKNEQELTINLDDLKHNEKLLSTEIDKLKDPDYLARYARENYLYSKDGEIVIRMDNEEDITTTDSKEMNFKYEYLVYPLGFILFLIFIHILKKSRKNT